MNKPFYNTINLPEQAMLDFDSPALCQEDLVIEVFKTWKRPLAWFEIRDRILGPIDECSLKRATTNLTSARKDKDGIVLRERMLEKTTELVTGPKGKPCHRYKLIQNDTHA